MKLVESKVYVIVHPVDPVKHPDVGIGFRWAVHIGNSNPMNLDTCANAGAEATREKALYMGDRCASTAIIAIAMTSGACMSLEYIHFDYDPLRPEDNKVRLLP